MESCVLAPQFVLRGNRELIHALQTIAKRDQRDGEVARFLFAIFRVNGEREVVDQRF